MRLSKDEIIQNMANVDGIVIETLYYPYGYEFTCFSCGYNVIKRKHELSKIQRKRK